MTNLLILLNLPEKVRQKYYDHLKARFPDLVIHMVDHHSKVGPYIASADILLTFGAHMSEKVLTDAGKLKWIQALGTGVDGIVDQPALREETLVTNIHGVHGDSVPEAALLAMLAMSRGLPRSVRSQDRRKWDRFTATLLKGKTVGIFGVGAIAENLAPKCKAFGMTVVGISSAVREVAHFDRMYARRDLERAVSEVDYLVVLTPLTAQTRNIVDAKVIAAMKPAAFLINLARGGVVEEEALIQALREKKIAGAALDVFVNEPLPDNHPFWSMENVIVTPHLGGLHDQYADQALPMIEENMRKFLAGDVKKMIHVVKH